VLALITTCPSNPSNDPDSRERSPDLECKEQLSCCTSIPTPQLAVLPSSVLSLWDGVEASLIQSPDFSALIVMTPRRTSSGTWTNHIQEPDLAKELDINGDGTFLDLPALKTEKGL
jgi:hypothetical protein